ncbi:MAG: DUF2339 domain-containing protein [Actinomycetota bacterium]|nr:DUF2339 domain-containing protein [Actinomycetota bacterium]
MNEETRHDQFEGEVPRDYVPPAFRHPSERPAQSEGPPPPLWDPISRIQFEEVLGGRILPWIGGLAFLLGVIFFMSITIDRGMLTEELRSIMAGSGSLLLLLVGIWLHERRGQAAAARMAVAAAISGLYATTVVTAQTYDLISPVLGLEAAAVIGAIGLALAVRWSSVIVASVGVLGALGAPLLVGVGTDDTSIAFVAVALAASVGVLLWQRWDWLSLGAFLVSAPQLAAWSLANEGEQTVLVLVALVGFWVLYAVASFGYELRTRSEESLSAASCLMLFGSSAVVIGLGYWVLDQTDNQIVADAWIFGFAAVHLLLGEIARRFGIHREVGSLLIGVSIGLTTFGLADAFDGPTLVAAWSAAGAGLAFLATRVDATPNPMLSDAERLMLTAAGFLTLALSHVLLVEAPPIAILYGVEDLGNALVGIASCAVAALACWRFGRQIYPQGATAAGFLGATALVYLGSVLIIDTVGVSDAGETGQVGQAWMSAFWAATGLGAVVWGLVRRAPSVRLGGLALLGVAIVKVWTYDLSELDELARAISFIGLGLLLLVGAYAYQRVKPGMLGEEAEEAEEAEELEPQVYL